VGGEEVVVFIRAPGVALGDLALEAAVEVGEGLQLEGPIASASVAAGDVEDFGADLGGHLAAVVAGEQRQGEGDHAYSGERGGLAADLTSAASVDDAAQRDAGEARQSELGGGGEVGGHLGVFAQERRISASGLNALNRIARSAVRSRALVARPS
jgi:hypothetical protein